MELNYPDIYGWTVYTKSDCVFCDSAKKLLSELGETLNIIDCDDVLKTKYIKAKFLEHIKQLIGKEYKTFPMIFKDNIFIGGYQDLDYYIKKQPEYKYKNIIIDTI
jgi:glutaredoxin